MTRLPGVHLNAPAAHTADPAEQRKLASKQLEAFFLRRVLAEAKPAGGGGMLDGGFAGETFKQMLDDTLADKMSASGGLGIAQMFEKQLGGAADPRGAQAAHGVHAITATAVASHGSSPVAAALPSNAPGPELPGMPRLAMPVIGTPTSGYGMRADPIQGKTINHPGFDLAAKVGTPVAAAAAGEVVHAGDASTYGNLVTIRHADGFETRYAHLSSVSVKVGDHVDAGSPIGNVGTTGYSTGPHLHFELRHDGKPMDPAPLLPSTRPLNSSPTRSKP